MPLFVALLILPRMNFALAVDSDVSFSTKVQKDRENSLPFFDAGIAVSALIFSTFAFPTLTGSSKMVLVTKLDALYSLYT